MRVQPAPLQTRYSLLPQGLPYAEMVPWEAWLSSTVYRQPSAAGRASSLAGDSNGAGGGSGGLRAKTGQMI